MKKAVLIIVLLFTVSAFCQTEKGNFIVGGSSNFSFTSSKSKIKTNSQDLDGPQATNVSFGPAGGFFVINNLALGLQAPISFEKSTEDLNGSGSVEVKSTSFAVSPFVRYYFSKSSIKPFLQGTIGLGRVKSQFESNGNGFSNSESKSNLFLYGFDGGVAIFINESISINLGVGYLSSSSKPDESSNDLKFVTNIIGLSAGINVFI
ncbi:outer membrane beta-barrel protein [Hyunsoonleella sp. SJ7]|uniref:Outer membrane beta-barrel protein n=1 Tax=Hyunsoonleella aquatilis TaxID=2762758 RepID=A0A923KM43_9FLAO|nr:outer membrane beta-barrel protein [Hyunsoonleella aquatilis]MBC3758630.1 outer membrane beta-barrel protein [Hyunsoonleella aquatilis]